MQYLQFGRLVAIFSILPIALANHLAFAADQSKAKPTSSSIVKWVDEKGVTHYGDSLPPQYSGKDNSLMNNQGVVIKRNQYSDAKVNPVDDKQAREQARRDKALLAAYTTEEEITLARDRNLQAEEIVLQGLELRLKSAQSKLDSDNKAANDLKKRRKKLPPDLEQDILNDQADIEKMEGQIKQQKANMESTAQRFDSEKTRFSQLKQRTQVPPATK